jgi:hypothetical protein
MDNDQRNIQIVFVYKAAFTPDIVCTMHFAVIGRKNYDCVIHHSEIFKFIKNEQQIIVVILNSVKVKILVFTPILLGGGCWSESSVRYGEKLEIAGRQTLPAVCFKASRRQRGVGVCL